MPTLTIVEVLKDEVLKRRSFEEKGDEEGEKRKGKGKKKENGGAKEGFI